MTASLGTGLEQTPLDQGFARILAAHMELDGDAVPELQDSLYDHGVDSYGMVKILVEIEDAFEVTFPDEVLTADTFDTVGSLWRVLQEVRNQTVAPPTTPIPGE